jgi:hypothetical protein
MQGRTGSALPSAIAAFAVAVSIIPLLTFGGVARAADPCLAAPNAPGPQGSHWYYRVERPSLRKCWHLVANDRKVQSAAAAPTLPQPDLAEADESASMPAASTPAANTPADRPQAEVAPPVIRNLVTRNVSNADDTVQPAPPDSSANTTPRTEIPNAPAAPAQTMSNERTAPPVTAPPVVSASAAPAKAAAISPGGGPTFGVLLATLAILGVLACAAFLVVAMMRRRADVLNRLAEADLLPLEAAPELSPAADAPTFAPLPPISLAPRTDDVDEALRRFARNFRRSAA